MRLSSMLLCGLMLTLSAGAAQARPANEVTTEYFSTAAKTNLIGETVLTCGGGRATWGRTSRYFTRTSDSCSQARIGEAALRRLTGKDREAQCIQACSLKFWPKRICGPNEVDCNNEREQCIAQCHEAFGGNR